MTVLISPPSNYLTRERTWKQRCANTNLRLPSAPTLGLSVTAMCDFTGLAAVNTLAGGRTVEGELERIGLDGEDEDTLARAKQRQSASGAVRQMNA